MNPVLLNRKKMYWCKLMVHTHTGKMNTDFKVYMYIYGRIWEE